MWERTVPATSSRSRRLTVRLVGRAIRRRIRRTLKFVLHRIDGSGTRMPDILMVLGCQRSGTTMLLDVFEHDLKAQVYRDISELTTEDTEGRLRLNRLESVEAEFRRCRAGLVVAKPIVDSQRAPEILEWFQNARGVWIYRDFRAVAASDLKLFGMDNGIRNLRPVVDGDLSNWRSEGVSPEVREIIREHFSPAMKPFDAAALFWYVRNILFFEKGLERHNRVSLVRYEDFVCEPVKALRAFYVLLNRPFPGPHLAADVHTESIRLSSDLGLTAPVVALCEQLMQRLDAHHNSAGATC